MIPEIKRLQDNGELTVDSNRRFCEKGVFDVEETRGILQAGKQQGWLINFTMERS